MGTLELSEMTKIFNEGDSAIVAVDDLSIEIDDGEFLILVGPSGCGKSTTLRCIAGLETVTEGEILLEGVPVTGKKPKDRGIAMVFQNYALYPHMTARENMSFGLKMTTDLSKEEITERVEEAAEMMGISELLEKKPRELSGGQQQRVALGRAIVRDPEVFLMDEPLSNLDAKLRTTMRTELQNLQQELGTTTIYVTHDQTEAMTMGDRIAILNDGELQQVGTPLECYHEPNNQFVAGFIGSPSMNFADVRVERTDDGTTVLENEAFRYPLSDEMNNRLRGDYERLVLGIRPEDIELARDEEERTIPATATVVEPLGDTTYVYLDIDAQQYTASVPGGVAVTPGEDLEIAFPEDRLHLFDAASGAAIVNRTAPPEQDVSTTPEYGAGVT